MVGLKKLAMGFKEGFVSFGRWLNDLLVAVLLSLVYWVGVGLTALLVKLLKKELLRLKEVRSESCWVGVKEKRRTLEECYRQF